MKWLALLLLAACARKSDAVFTHRPVSSLPFSDLGWVKMHDHFVQTVGPRAGQGAPLGELLVLADATFAPHSQFPLHEHREMEIVSVVLSGTLTHREPEAAVPLPARSVQLMSARGGITHAEGNDTAEPVRMLQLWVRPASAGGPAQHRRFGPFELGPKWAPVTPADLRQDATVSMAHVGPGEKLELSVKPGRQAYVLCAGEAKFAAQALGDGDGLHVESGSGTFSGDATLVLIDLRR